MYHGPNREPVLFASCVPHRREFVYPVLYVRRHRVHPQPLHRPLSPTGRLHYDQLPCSDILYGAPKTTPPCLSVMELVFWESESEEEKPHRQDWSLELCKNFPAATAVCIRRAVKRPEIYDDPVHPGLSHHLINKQS